LLDLIGDYVVPFGIQVQIISKECNASIPIDRLCQIKSWNPVGITDLTNLALRIEDVWLIELPILLIDLIRDRKYYT
jgi:hypothetical protein